MNLYQPTISGSLEVSGSVTINGTLRVLSGSVTGTASLAENSLLLGGLNSGSFQSTSSFSSFSGSLSTRLVTDEANIATNTAASASFAAQSASLSTRLTTDESNFTSLSSSFVTTSGSVAGRVTLIEGQYATTGSNNFTKPQQISDVSNAISFTSTASLYTDGGLRVKGSSFISGTAYFNDVVVYGTSSIEYITSSQLAIGTNIITLNTDTPSVRFGGISVFDSGSNNQSTGSLFWDSEKDKWIYSNPSASTYDGGMLISGPRNTSGLGNEVGTTSCALMMGQGGDHITSSAIFSYGNATCFYGQSYISSTGTACLSNAVCSCASTTLYAYFDGSSTVLSNPTDRPHIFRLANGGLGLSANNEGAGSQPIRMYTCGQERITILNNGKVGISCATPSYVLDVAAGSNGDVFTPAARITTSTGGAGGATILQINHTANTVSGLQITQYGATPGNGAYINNTENSYLAFGSNNVERFRIAATGAACFACELTAKTLGTNDLILNNLNYECANYVDGTRGSWLIQEGACDLFIINQISCKKYKFNLIEID